MLLDRSNFKKYNESIEIPSKLLTRKGNRINYQNKTYVHMNDSSRYS